MNPLYILSNINTEGKVVINTVPNNSGTVLTYNPTTKEVSTRTNAEFISDMGLATASQLNGKADRQENAVAIGFSNGNADLAPYFIHDTAGLRFLATQTWVNAELASFVTQSSLNSQLSGYATLAGVQAFQNTITFIQSPVVPNGTLGQHAVNLNQLDEYVSRAGSILDGGGKINQFGSITLQQNSSLNATGLFWENLADTGNVAGIGALTTGNTLHGVYMGWSVSPWEPQNSLSVSINHIKYKGFDIWHGDNFNPNDYATSTSVINSLANKVNSETNAVALGFIGGTDTPYVKHSNGTEVRVATETWSSNSFLTIYSDQNVTGIKTFTVSPKVPLAIEFDDAIPLGQADEIVQIRINGKFAEVIYKNSANDLIFDFSYYRGVKIVTITCKGNNFQNIRVEHMPKSVTLKILNASSSLNTIVYFDGGIISTGIGNATWTEFYKDQDGDILKSNINGTTII